MKKGVKAWRGIVCCLLAVSLIVGAVPFSALNQFNYAYANSPVSYTHLDVYKRQG